MIDRTEIVFDFDLPSGESRSIRLSGKEELRLDFEFVSLTVLVFTSRDFPLIERIPIFCDDNKFADVELEEETSRSYRSIEIKKVFFPDAFSDRAFRIYAKIGGKEVNLGRILCPRVSIDFFAQQKKIFVLGFYQKGRKQQNIARTYESAVINVVLKGLTESEIELDIGYGYLQVILYQVPENPILYRSNPLPNKSFLNHLDMGDFPLVLQVRKNPIELGSLRRSNAPGDAGAPFLQQYLFMLSEIFSTESQNLIPQMKKVLSTANLPAVDEMERRNPIEIVRMNRYLCRVFREIKLRHYRLPSRVNLNRQTLRYRRGLPLDSHSLRGLVRSPAFLQNVKNGRGALDFSNFAEEVDAPHKTDSLETIEIRLLINSAIEVHSEFAALIKSMQESSPTLLENWNEELWESIQAFCVINNLDSKVNYPSLIPKVFVLDRWFGDLGKNLVDWLKGTAPAGESSGDTKTASIPRADVVWELYCLYRLSACLKSLGLTHSHELSNYEAGIIAYVGDVGEAQITYDTRVAEGQRLGSHFNTGLDRSLRPDYLISSNINGKKRIGVLDAKFTPDRNRWRERSEEIWKYALLLGDTDGNAIAYCHALVPSLRPIEAAILPTRHPDSSMTPLGPIALQLIKADKLGDEALRGLFL